MSIVLRGFKFEVTLDAYAWESDSHDICGVYAFVHLHGQVMRVLYIGETESLKASMRDHEYWAVAIELGATHVFAAQVPDERKEVEHDLVQAICPELNMKDIVSSAIDDCLAGFPASPYAAPTAPSGIHDLLDALMEKPQGLGQFVVQEPVSPTPNEVGTVVRRYGGEPRAVAGIGGDAQRPSESLPKTTR
jgi:hypothetical protein